jgi:hypothetical protein
MIKNWKVFKTKLIDYVYRTNKELFEESHLRYFYAPESEMAGAISGALMLYLAKQNKPLIGFNVGNGDTKVSSRGTRRMVKHGLNLSLVMKEAGKKSEEAEEGMILLQVQSYRGEKRNSSLK